MTDMLTLFHTPTEAFRQYARVTQQGVVLWLWRSDLDDVELVLGLVHAYMTAWLLRGARGRLSPQWRTDLSQIYDTFSRDVETT